MNKYLENSKRFNWGLLEEPLNVHKIKLLDHYAKGKILDVACATGRYTNYLGTNAQGIDNQPELIKKAKRAFPKISFNVGDAYDLPFQKNTFDTVILFDILEHLDDVKVLKEAMRVGKRFVISVPRKNQAILTKYSLAHHHYLDRTHVRDYTPSSLRSLLKSQNLKVVMCEESLPISVTALAASHLSKGSKILEPLIKVLLRIFGKEESIYSTVFAVAEKTK